MKTVSEECRVFATGDVAADLAQILQGRDPGQVFLLTDEGSCRHCLPLLGEQASIPADHVLTIPSSDDHKDYASALAVWQFLSSRGATRRALLVNLGGGMPCDLGGFCAATFKRGIEFVNIPTTLLAQVDASLGGKTGMNLGSLKNEIGVFAMASRVLLCADFLRTLDRGNLLSGFAEMIKHALIRDAAELEGLLAFSFERPDFALLQEMVVRSVRIKEHFVCADPHERGLRKALNFGHTFGHAFETFAMRHARPVLHGMAVAHGMVCEILLSRDKMGLPAGVAEALAGRIVAIYGKPEISLADADELLELMTHDKKNDGAGINFTLLPAVGSVEVNQVAAPGEIRKVLEDCLNL